MSRKRCKTKRANPETFFYHKFPRYGEIQSYLKMLVMKYPRKVRVEKLGCSYQGRSIEMIILQSNQGMPKDSVMIEGGVHAREWLGDTTVLYIIDYLIKHPKMLRLMDFYIIPCLNPDGYEYTHTHERLWRKNMNPNGSEDKKCWGVDVNRNFPYGYGRPGSSSSPSSFMYRGKHSLSEPEAQCVAHALSKYGKRIKLYIAIHCYGNLLMYPWGFTLQPLPDERILHACADKAKTAMKRAYCDSCFRVGRLSKIMYLSSGGSSDYARGTHKIKFSYTMELHKGGKSGFTPSTRKILRVGKETVIGIMAMVKFVHKYYSCKRRKRSRSLFQLV